MLVLIHIWMDGRMAACVPAARARHPACIVGFAVIAQASTRCSMVRQAKSTKTLMKDTLRAPVAPLFAVKSGHQNLPVFPLAAKHRVCA